MLIIITYCIYLYNWLILIVNRVGDLLHKVYLNINLGVDFSTPSNLIGIVHKEDICVSNAPFMRIALSTSEDKNLPDLDEDDSTCSCTGGKEDCSYFFKEKFSKF